MKHQRLNRAGPLSHAERGLTLIEVMLSLVLLSISALGITYSLITSVRVEKITEVHLAASSLAQAKVEELSAVDSLNLNSSYNEIDAIVSIPGLNMTFTRNTTITVNADSSRTIHVRVVSNKSKLPATADFETRFALWE